MNYTTQFGLPQIIIIISGLFGLILLISFFAGIISKRPKVDKLEDEYGRPYLHRRHRRSFRWLNAGGGIILLLIAFLLFWIASAAQQYLALTGKVQVAHMRAVKAQTAPGSLPMMSVELTLYDQNGNASAPKTYILNGDEAYIGGDVIQYQGWLNIVGFHSGYKVTKLEGMYSDVNLERHAEHSVQVLNGGDDDFFNMAYHQGLNSFAVTAAYKNGSTVPTNGIGYNICASQDAIVPQPDNQPC
jgi:hypothetical protein